jgi:hypothetical protein
MAKKNLAIFSKKNPCQPIGTARPSYAVHRVRRCVTTHSTTPCARSGQLGRRGIEEHWAAFSDPLGQGLRNAHSGML